MPIPFERFRLLNETSKNVNKASFKWHPEALVRPEIELLDDFDLTTAALGGPIAASTTRELGAQIYDVKNISITELEVDAGVPKREVLTWEIFYPDDDYDPEANKITWVDLFVRPLPATVGEYYAVARVTFADGNVWDYFSPKFSS